MSEISSGSIERALDEEGIFASVTEGVSMRPLFKTHRDMVILKKPNGVLKKYDVVLYKAGAKYLLHRIIKVDNDRKVYVIRGDNTFKLEYVPFSGIIAYLTAFNRKGKSHKVTDKGYLTYAKVWNLIYPLRYPIHLLRMLLGKIYRMIFGKRKRMSR